MALPGSGATGSGPRIAVPGLTWLGRAAGAPSSLSESSSLLSDSVASAAATATAALAGFVGVGVTFPNLVGPGAVLAGGFLAGAAEALAWGVFAEDFT